jgi:hypothetical protein
MTEEKKTTIARFPENRWWQLRKQFMRTMPKSVDTNDLSTIFSIGKGAAGNLVSVLKQLGLVDIEGKPTELANKWRNYESYGEACHSMLEDIYSQGLRDVEPGPDVDRARVSSWITRNLSL